MAMSPSKMLQILRAAKAEAAKSTATEYAARLDRAVSATNLQRAEIAAIRAGAMEDVAKHSAALTVLAVQTAEDRRRSASKRLEAERKAAKDVREAGRGAYRIEADPQPDVLGLRRVRLRVLADNAPLGMLDFVNEVTVDLALQVPGQPDIRAILKDASGGGTLVGGTIRVAVGEPWSDVFFELEGPRDDKQPLEITSPSAKHRVPSLTLSALFTVTGKARTASAPVASPATGHATSWLHQITDSGHQAVMLHLSTHGSITEAELNTLLGHPRLSRQFAAQLELLTNLAPFAVEVEATPSGKRYVRVRDDHQP